MEKMMLFLSWILFYNGNFCVNAQEGQQTVKWDSSSVILYEMAFRRKACLHIRVKTGGND